MSEFRNIVKEDTNLFKKVIFVISIAFILIILNSYSYKINALLVNENDLASKLEKESLNLVTKNTVPIYISNFWKTLPVHKIPNNHKKYNCTATIQMLYAVWLKNLSQELGYTSVNEMLNYSLKVIKIKEIMDNIFQDPLKFTLTNYNPSILKLILPKEKESWEKIYHILNSNYYGRITEYDAIDNFLLKIGLIDSDFETATWEVIELMLNKGYAVYEKKDKTGKRGIDLWKEAKIYLPLDNSAINFALPGDILTGKYYATNYKDKYTTHLTVYLGRRNEEEHSFAEQFGKETRIVSLDKMYKALRTGFEAIFRPVIIIAKEDTQKFLATPLSNYNFGNHMPEILFFKDEAKNFLFPFSLSVNEVIKEEKEVI